MRNLVVVDGTFLAAHRQTDTKMGDLSCPETSTFPFSVLATMESWTSTRHDRCCVCVPVCSLPVLACAVARTASCTDKDTPRHTTRPSTNTQHRHTHTKQTNTHRTPVVSCRHPRFAA